MGPTARLIRVFSAIHALTCLRVNQRLFHSRRQKHLCTTDCIIRRFLVQKSQPTELLSMDAVYSPAHGSVLLPTTADLASTQCPVGHRPARYRRGGRRHEKDDEGGGRTRPTGQIHRRHDRHVRRRCTPTDGRREPASIGVQEDLSAVLLHDRQVSRQLLHHAVHVHQVSGVE